VAQERLQRALARAGLGSRRSSEQLIVDGRVTVNGRVATLGDKVDPAVDEIRLDGTAVNLDPGARYYAVHKPRGVVTTMRDPQGRPDLRSLLPSDDDIRVFPVGRLDQDSEGLLLMTNDGSLADRLTHPRYGIEKEYLVEVGGRPTSRHLAAIRRGVPLVDGPAAASSIRLVDARDERAQLSIVMTEGRKREVRRMLAEVGLPVTRLLRIRIGTVTLGGLAAGALRELSVDEVVALTKLTDKAERRLRRSSGSAL
jgi:23S rRNA pseudouridine2605 synthase